MKSFDTTAERNGLRFADALAMQTESGRWASMTQMSIRETWFIATTHPLSPASLRLSASETSTVYRRTARAVKTKMR